MRVAEWTRGDREAPEPYEGNVVATIAVATLVWAVLFVAQLPFYASGWHHDHGHERWLWICLAGFGGGLVGLWYVRRRDAAIRARSEGEAGDGAGDGAGPGEGRAS